jgi:hypothetical protein
MRRCPRLGSLVRTVSPPANEHAGKFRLAAVAEHSPAIWRDQGDPTGRGPGEVPSPTEDPVLRGRYPSVPRLGRGFKSSRISWCNWLSSSAGMGGCSCLPERAHLSFRLVEEQGSGSGPSAKAGLRSCATSRCHEAKRPRFRSRAARQGRVKRAAKRFALDGYGGAELRRFAGSGRSRAVVEGPQKR